MSPQRFSDAQMARLLTVAEQAIRDYFDDGIAKPHQLINNDLALSAKGACFVTLKVAGKLQGCLGSLDAHQPLALEVYDKAFSSTHLDRRFSPLPESHLFALTIEVSVLSPSIDFEAENESALLDHLTQHKLGVILEDQQRRAVFLPQVWQQLPKPADFIAHLKTKGGWEADYWSSTMKVSLFGVQSAEKPYSKISS